MQWSFSNKLSAVPQFLSFRDAQEDRSRKIVHDPVASSGFMNISAADVFESSQKPYSGVIQVFSFALSLSLSLSLSLPYNFPHVF
jgi:jasmonate ZIM domain-containing protein